MAKLTPDATRTEHGLVINEKIIPWGAVWPKDSGAYKKGAQLSLIHISHDLCGGCVAR